MTRLFDPWVGSQYQTGGFRGLRVLILGESHYGEPEEETKAFTREWVEGYASSAKGNRFFTVVTKLLLALPVGIRLSRGTRRTLWDSVAFYNYIQRFPGQHSRIRPTSSMWNAAAECFPAVLSELQPTFTLILGRELAGRVPKLPSSISVCDLPHPSSFGFEQARWSNHVQAALARAERYGSIHTPPENSLAQP
jgi:hypothetical protein